MSQYDTKGGPCQAAGDFDNSPLPLITRLRERQDQLIADLAEVRLAIQDLERDPTLGGRIDRVNRAMRD